MKETKVMCNIFRISFIMPGYRALDPDKMKDYESGTAGNKEYNRQVERILDHFVSYLRDKEKDDRPMDQIVEHPEEFELVVKKFFYSLTVEEVEVSRMTGKKTKTGKQIPPTIGYARNIKSTLFKSFTSKFKVMLKRFRLIY